MILMSARCHLLLGLPVSGVRSSARNWLCNSMMSNSRCLQTLGRLARSKLAASDSVTPNTRQMARLPPSMFQWFRKFDEEDYKNCASPPWKVMFFGSDQFAVTSLIALNRNRQQSEGKVIESLDVVSVNRPTPINKVAKKLELTSYEWPMPLEYGKYDVGVVVSFGHLIPDEVIQMFPFGILNVHPSLLPRWRGCSPVMHSILNGDTVTGVSIMEIRPKHFDIGPVLLQQLHEIPPDATSSKLSQDLAHKGANLLLQALENLPALERNHKNQSTTGITYAHKVKPSMALVDWIGGTRSDIWCQYRALGDTFDLKTEYKGMTVRLLDMVSPSEMEGIDVWMTKLNKYIPRGTPCYNQKNDILCVQCKDGWVGFRKVKLRKTMTAGSFNNGYLSKKENRDYTFVSHDNDLNRYIFRQVVNS